MPAQDEYKVDLEVFEGPLDLLLYLIKKDEIDIYDIPIESVTRQYCRYLDLMRMLDLNIAGEFIVMAATLMMIKSRMLLPVDERPELEEEDDVDPRWELVRKLVEYKKFKDVALDLHDKELDQENRFGRGGENVVLDSDLGMSLKDVNIFDLISAFNEALSRVKPEEIGEIEEDTFTVAEKIDMILTTVRSQGKVLFGDLFGSMAGRSEIICTFLGLLELIRLKQVKVAQEGKFGEIIVVGVEE